MSSLFSWLAHSFLHLHVFGGFPDFVLGLVTSVLVSWLASVHGTTSILWYWLRDALCATMWSLLVNEPCALQTKADCMASRCRVLKISVKAMVSKVSCMSVVSWGSFCLADLSIAVNGVATTPGISTFLSVRLFLCLMTCWIYFGASVFGAQTFLIGSSCWGVDPEMMICDDYIMPFFIPCSCVSFKVHCVWQKDRCSGFPGTPSSVMYHSASPDVQWEGVLQSKMSLL